MIIDSNNFRDKALAQVTIGYDWINLSNYALISVLEDDETTVTYRISGLSKYCLYEDFGCMTITECKFINDEEGLYLSLDSFSESGPREENDNFCFWGKTIGVENDKC